MGNRSINLAESGLSFPASDRSIACPLRPKDSPIIRLTSDAHTVRSSLPFEEASTQEESHAVITNRLLDSQRDIVLHELWKLTSQESIGDYLDDNNRNSISSLSGPSRSLLTDPLATSNRSSQRPDPIAIRLSKKQGPNYDQLIEELQGLQDHYTDRPKGSFYDALMVTLTQQINNQLFTLIVEGKPGISPALDKVVKQDKR